MAEDRYWDADSYVRIERARYDASTQALEVAFRDGDVVRLSAWRLLRPDQRDPQWDRLEVVDNYWVHVPATPLDVDLPGFTIRSIADPLFAAHLAREAEESARRVGTRLQELRKARGFTTQQVADRVGMPQQSLSRIEQGRHAVSFPTLEKILVAMGYSLDDIRPEQAGSRQAATGMAQVTPSDDQLMLILQVPSLRLRMAGQLWADLADAGKRRVQR